MTLYDKYRPTNLDKFYGNRPTVEALDSVINRHEGPPHAILFTGPSGCGKTTLARIVANAINCAPLDYKELNSADFRGIDTIRDIIRQMPMKPIAGPVRVWLIDECHQLSKDAQNAILKALEEPPTHTYFILATTDPHKLLKTIITRCMEFRVQPLGERQMMKLLSDVLNAEGKKVSGDVLELIAKESIGSPRAALVALNKVMGLDANMQVKAVEKAMAEENQAINLCRALIAGKSWGLVSPILKGLQDLDPEQVRRAVLGYCNTVLLNEDSMKAAAIIKEFQYPTYDAGWPALTAACYMYVDLNKK